MIGCLIEVSDRQVVSINVCGSLKTKTDPDGSFGGHEARLHQLLFARLRAGRRQSFSSQPNGHAVPFDPDLEWVGRHIGRVLSRAKANSPVSAFDGIRSRLPSRAVCERLVRAPEHRKAMIRTLIEATPSEFYAAAEPTIYHLLSIGPDWPLVEAMAADGSNEKHRSRAIGLLQAKSLSLFLL